MRQRWFCVVIVQLIDAEAAHRPRCHLVQIMTHHTCACTLRTQPESASIWEVVRKITFQAVHEMFLRSCINSVWRAQVRRLATAWQTRPRQALEGLLRLATTAAPAVAAAPCPAAALAATPIWGRPTCKPCAAWRPTARRHCWCGAASHPAMQLGARVLGTAADEQRRHRAACRLTRDKCRCVGLFSSVTARQDAEDPIISVGFHETHAAFPEGRTIREFLALEYAA